MKIINYKNLSRVLYLAIGAGIASAVFLILFSGLWKYRALENAIESAGEHKYDIASYNCVDFSQDAQEQLKSENIGSNVVVIQKDINSKTTHAILGVWIDPQTGEFVSDSKYLGDYNELKNQFGWADR